MQIISTNKLCPYQVQEKSGLVGNGAPTGVICSSRCALFVMLSGSDGKVTGGDCAHRLFAVAQIQRQQEIASMMPMLGALLDRVASMFPNSTPITRDDSTH